MSGVNKVIIIGNVGRKPERRSTGSGQTVTSFSVCVNEKHGGKEKATWLNVVAWGNLGDVCAEYLDKGRSVFVEGRIDVRTIESNDGQRRTFTDIVAHNVQFLSPSKQQQRTSDAENTFGPPPTFGAMDEDVPF